MRKKKQINSEQFLKNREIFLNYSTFSEFANLTDCKFRVIRSSLEKIKRFIWIILNSFVFLLSHHMYVKRENIVFFRNSQPKYERIQIKFQKKNSYEKKKKKINSE